MASKVTKSFVQELVLGFGFLSGLWICVGINPQVIVLKKISDIVMSISPNPLYSFIFWLIPIVVVIISLVSTYVVGGKLGLVAIGCAFVGGIYIISTTGIIFLIVGIILGFIAPYRKK